MQVGRENVHDSGSERDISSQATSALSGPQGRLGQGYLTLTGWLAERIRRPGCSEIRNGRKQQKGSKICAKNQ